MIIWWLMRNLYKRLGVSESASANEISTAIRMCNDSALRIDASEVLLNENRKRSYDKIHRTLEDIGSLRAEFCLNNSEHWKDNIATDYSKESPHKAQSNQPAPAHKKQYSDNFLVNTLMKLFMWCVDLVIQLLKGVLAGLLEFALRLLPLALIVVIAWFFIDADETKKVEKQPEVVFEQPEIKSPSNGSVRKWTSAPSLAPLSIDTSAGSDYLVKLVDANTGNDVLDVYVKGGRNIELKVPLGSYHIKYASGEKWYGYEHLFGPKTGYSKADSLFRFEDTGYQVTGYTLTLYRVTNGNLRTQNINKSQF